MKIIAFIIGLLTIPIGYFGYQQQKTEPLNTGAFSDPFLSLQLATNPQANYILSTDGTNNSWIVNSGGGGGSTLHVDGGGFVYPQTGDYHSAPRYVATSTTASSTFIHASTTYLTIGDQSWFNGTTTWASDIHPIMHGIYAADSSGLHLHSSGGTEVAYFGAGGGANVTFPGYTSALLQTGASGAVAEYSGTTCTNQFTRALSALGIATCESVEPTDLASSDFGDFTCNGTTCSLDNTYVTSRLLTYDATNDILEAATTTTGFKAAYFTGTSTTATSSFANLSGVMYADEFTGADIGAKINAAYAALPTTGGEIVVSESGSFSTAIDISTANKPALIRCTPGVKLTYTGSATSTTFDTNTTSYVRKAGMEGCWLLGQNDSTSVGIELGGSNGAARYEIANNRIIDFNTGLYTGNNTYLIDVHDNVIEYNDRNVWIAGTTNAGENLTFRHNNISDCDTVTKCFYMGNSTVSSLNLIGNSFDDAQVYIEPGSSNVKFTGGHFENPANASIGRYTYIYVASSNFTNVSIDGVGFYNSATTLGNSPYQFIEYGSNVSISGITVQSFNGVTSPAFAQAITGASGANLTVFDFEDIADAVEEIATTTSTVGFVANEKSVGVGTSSPAYKLDIAGTGNLFRIIYNATTELMTVVNNVITLLGTWDFGGATVTGLPYYPAFTYATTTWTGTTTIPLGTAYNAQTWAGVQCFTDTGTLFVQFNDGSNNMNSFQASTTVGAVGLTTNNSFTAREKRYVKVGTPASSPTEISCSVSYQDD